MTGIAIVSLLMALPATGQDPAAGAHASSVSEKVVPIDDSRFIPMGRLSSKSRELEECAKIFLNSVRYNGAWSRTAIEKLEGTRPFDKGQAVKGRGAHNFI